MCGILGYFSASSKISAQTFSSSLNTLNYRGPDNQSVAEFDTGFLGHARLAIIDLDACSNQPFSVDDRYSLTFNGEIYNYQEVKEVLIQRFGITFQTNSDTEVLLRAYILLGEECLSLLNGMFAFAIYDRLSNEIFAARDRVGKKPFYYFASANRFGFASELKALLPLIGRKPELDFFSVSEFISIGYIIAPRTIYQDIFKLEPAHSLRINLNTFETKKNKYWDPVKSARNYSAGELSALIQNSVDIRYNADVPVGIMLSGGIDSNIVLALSKDKKPRTFTVKTKQSEYDESELAAKSAAYFGCENVLKTVEPDSSILDTLVHHFDEPMADSSAIPTHLLSKIISENNYRCVLNGDGADEIFAGYDRYKLLLLYTKFRFLEPLIPNVTKGTFKYKGFFYNLQKLKSHFQEKSVEELWASQNIINKGFEGEALKHIDYRQEILKRINAIDDKTLNRFIIYNFQYTLPDDLLVKMDRATMANALESRSPFLDYRLAEMMLNVKFEEKISIRKNKKHLRQLFERILPSFILNRKKTGFQIPIDHWFLNELRGEIIALKQPSAAIIKNKFVNAAYVTSIVDAHLEQRANYKFEIYLLLIFEKWYSKWIEK